MSAQTETMGNSTMISRVEVARLLVGESAADILHRHPCGGDMMVNEGLRNIANGHPPFPELIVQAGLAVAQPNIAECLRIKPTHSEEDVAADRHVDTPEERLGPQPKLLEWLHEAQDAARLVVHEPHEPRRRRNLPNRPN